MGPLAGLKVVEMAGLAPGPFCAMLLADMGAEVLRIERPGVAEVHSNPRHYLLNRSRDTVAVDMKAADGVAVMKKLLSGADVFIEGFRPGVMERLGLGPDDCLAVNPRLIYGRMTGWGQEGPLALAAGHDLNYIALTGLLHSLGRKGEPPAIPLNLLGDFGGGGLYLAFGILSALYERVRSGQGQVVDAAMIDGASSLMTYIHGQRGEKTWSDTRGENLLDGASPWYQVYETKDGLYVSIAAGEQKFYDELLRRTGIDRENPPPREDRKNWPVLRARFTEVFRGKTRDEWCALMEGSDVCFAPVLNIPEAIAHPHNRARGTFVEVDGVVQPAPAPRFGRSNPEKPRLPEAPGTNTEGVMANWGFGAHEIAALRRSGVLQ
jgi:alpha-methylacyl-CoA racemase